MGSVHTACVRCIRWCALTFEFCAEARRTRMVRGPTALRHRERRVVILSTTAEHDETAVRGLDEAASRETHVLGAATACEGVGEAGGTADAANRVVPLRVEKEHLRDSNGKSTDESVCQVVTTGYTQR